MRNAVASEDAVTKATGRGWSEWLKLLDRAGAKTMAHGDIAAEVAKLGCKSGWWQQAVAVTYERERGLRDVHETTRGFVANVSRTFAANVSDVYAAWDDARRRAKWLGRQKLTIRKATPDKVMRITWPDGSSVEVYFATKGDAKSNVAVQHGKLKNASDVKEKKAMWAEAMGKLKALVES
ncbi:MAG TPA: hypothetical protein VG106_09865 [Vicinamibacterales bacterium]|nr:hypothetical protein [Vicinamibacterales bacterium]